MGWTRRRRSFLWRGESTGFYQMGDSKVESKMEGWLYLIRSSRFGHQYSRKRYFVLKDSCLRSFKILPVNDEEVLSPTPFFSYFPMLCFRFSSQNLKILTLLSFMLIELIKWVGKSSGPLTITFQMSWKSENVPPALRNELCKRCSWFFCWQLFVVYNIFSDIK